MLKLKVSVTGLALLGMLGYVYIDFTSPITGVEVDENIVTLSSDFNKDSTDAMYNAFKDIHKVKTDGERGLLTITSPGGEVAAGRRALSQMNGGVTFDTYIPTRAASMGADAFMQGERRYIEPDAILIFHGAFGGGSYFNAEASLEIRHTMVNLPIIEELYKQVLTGKTPELNKLTGEDTPLNKVEVVKLLLYMGYSADEARAGGEAILKALETNLETVKHEIGSERDLVRMINRTALHSFKLAIEQSKGKLTEAIILDKVFANFKKDVFITGQQAYDMGLATHLGAPPEADYESDK
jgi:ATP-dependent protease ClpP protease subunit